MKLLSWNVNGIRSAGRKGFLPWLARSRAEVLCLQETRAWPEQLEENLLRPGRYRSWWAQADRKGYSGVALYSRIEPLDIAVGLGIPRFDCEGRVLTARFADFTLVNAYFPNGQPDLGRVTYKMEFCTAFLEFCQARRRRGESLVLCGDFNTAHQEIDLARPRENRENTGFLLLERAWIDELVAAGYVDIFRALHPGPHHYTWWHNQTQARQRNVGWRIDYHFVSADLVSRVERAFHLPDVMGSDHCPVGLALR